MDVLIKQPVAKNKSSRYLLAGIILILLVTAAKVIQEDTILKIKIRASYEKLRINAYFFVDELFGLFGPLNALNENTLRHKISKPAAWVSAQIEKDFAAQQLLSKQSAYDGFKSLPEDYFLVLFNIKDGRVKISLNNHGFDEQPLQALKLYTRIFNYIAKHAYVRDLSFVLRFSDEFIAKTSAQSMPPILSMTKNTENYLEQDLILIPDFMNIEDSRDLHAQMDRANKKYSWKDKDYKILWRGGLADRSGFRRVVVEYSERNPDSILDAKFCDRFKDANVMQPEEQVKARFLLNIDGSTHSWTRPVWQLLSNSVMLKQDSTLKGWFYNAIQPNIHYLPVASDPIKLIKAVDRYTEQELLTITANGQQFARENLSLEDMIAYLILVLQKYESLQSNLSDL